MTTIWCTAFGSHLNTSGVNASVVLVSCPSANSSASTPPSGLSPPPSPQWLADKLESQKLKLSASVLVSAPNLGVNGTNGASLPVQLVSGATLPKAMPPIRILTPFVASPLTKESMLATTPLTALPMLEVVSMANSKSTGGCSLVSVVAAQVVLSSTSPLPAGSIEMMYVLPVPDGSSMGVIS